MSKEKEMLKTIIANTNAIMEFLKIKNGIEKPSEKAPKIATKGTKVSKPAQRKTAMPKKVFK